MAKDGGWRREAAQAQRLLGQCALAGGAFADATPHFRAALDVLIEISAALEADRTRLALAEALETDAAMGHRSDGSDEVSTLLAQARTGFATRGAAWDLARAEQIAQRLES